MRDLQSRFDEMKRQHDADMNSLKTDLRLSKEDTMRFQQDLEDAEAKLKDGELDLLQWNKWFLNFFL